MIERQFVSLFTVVFWTLVVLVAIRLGWLRYFLYAIGALGFGVIVGSIIYIAYEWKQNHAYPQKYHDSDCPVVGGIPVDSDSWSCQCDG